MRAIVVLGVAAVLALSLAACSSSTKKDASTASSASTTGAPASSGSASSSDPLAAAEAAYKAAETFPTKISVSDPLNTTPPKGKTLVFIQCKEVSCGLQAQGIQAAADALGWTLKVLNFDDTNPATLVTAMTTALQYNPLAVFFAGPAEDVWAPMKDAYRKAGVLIIPDAPGGTYPTIDDVVPGVTQSIKWQNAQGVSIADFIAADSKGKANILFETVPSYATFVPMAATFKAEIAKTCPACTISELDNTIPQLFAGQVNSTIVAKLRTDPSINYVATVDGAFITGLPAALQPAGLAGKYKIVSAGGGAQTYSDIATGTETATTGQGFLYDGWASVDIVLRHMQGLPIPAGDDALQPTPLITKDNVPNPVPSGGTLDLPADYATQFKALWKLS